MNKKLISALVAGLALSAVAPAHAFSLGGYSGPVTFKLAGADVGALYSATCSSSAGCDAVQIGGAGNILGGNGTEDSWGIFQVTAVLDAVNNTLWTQGTGGEYIVGKFGGLTDVASTVTTSKQYTWSTGGSFEMFLTGNSTLISGLIAGAPAASTRTAVTGSSFLSGVFSGTADANVGGCLGSDPVADLFGCPPGQLWQTNTASNEFGASTKTLNSIGYMDFTAGGYLAMFEPLTIPDAAGDLQDANFFFNWDKTNTTVGTGWTVPYQGDVYTGVIPEPGSMALAGLSLMGLAALRRRKQQA